ncbi:fibronectin type III domain-containing protein, partial [Nocardioides sp.]|uniref:fibronectin type III domain-containing protein n=1 Tax=Nocardioides sp. TaxID=35761 RepID=UPI002732D463
RGSALLALVGGLLTAVVASGPPAAADASDWCSVDATTPCIVSVTHNGAAVPADDPVWQVDLSPTDHGVAWALRQSGDYRLDSEAAGRWRVRVNTGTIVPRVVYGIGRSGAVTRSGTTGAYQVIAEAAATRVAEECDMSSWPWVCPSVATATALRFSGEISNWNNWEDKVQRAAFWGVDFWTNVVTNSFPPGIQLDDTTGLGSLRLDFGAPHFEDDGTTVFRGHAELRLPNAFLRHNFFIPDPELMTPAGLLVAGGGPESTAVVRKDSASAPMTVEVTDMTFSTRRLRVRTGVIVPRRPTRVRGTRTSPTSAKLRYRLAQARGAKVTGYRARCVPPSGPAVKAKRRKNASPLKVTGLRPGARYTCRVRAQSKAGPGPWSKRVKVAPRR